MRKVINGKVYDTDKSEEIFHWSNDYAMSDFRWREKTLYRTAKGAWFLFHEGGPMTDMATRAGDMYTSGKDIEVLDKDDVIGFLEKHQAINTLEKYFPDYLEEA